MSNHPKAKRLLLELETGNLVYIRLDGTNPGCQLPSPHNKNTAVLLILGLHMPTPMQRFACDERGFQVTLSFSGRPFDCQVPWDAVWFLKREDSEVSFVDSFAMPMPDLPAPAAEANPPAPPPEKPRPRLSLVPMPAEDTEHLDAIATRSSICRRTSLERTEECCVWNPERGLWEESDEQLRSRIR